MNLLYVGRLSYEKGLEHLIKSMHQLGPEMCRLLICGEGPDRKRLENLVNESGLNDCVDFLGFIPWGKRLSEVYVQSDIFILPSLSEGIPKVLLEAMAKGLPVVATNVGGIPDIISGEENGILVPSGDSQAITDAVRLLISDKSLRERIIANGYKFAQAHTAEKQAKKIAEIIYKYVDVAR